MANPTVPGVADTWGRALARQAELLQQRFRVSPRPGASVALAQAVLDRLARADPTTADWRVAAVPNNLSEFRCVAIADPAGQPVAMLKLAGTPHASVNLRRNAEGLRRLADDPRLSDWSGIVPRVVGTGTVRDVPFLVEGWVPGVAGDRSAGDAAAQGPLLERAAAVIRGLQSSTSGPPAAHALEESIGRPTRILVDSARRPPEAEYLIGKLDVLSRELRADSSGQGTATSHSDFWLGNVFFTPDLGSVTGIVDWSGLRPAALADVDLVTLVLTARPLRRRQELGDAVLAVLIDGWEGWERELLAAFAVGEEGWAAEPAAVLVAWLWLVAGNMEKDARFSPGSVWFRRNVRRVLDRVVPAST